ncbi:hypothetical protein V6N13_130569 [Hibiscus sabdariffa]|uniref:Uncharacterized protein n=2 Tax=Hibiscus sabdariffa TaxID=183260 RepID=A0ABR2AMX0_9ROSI
MGNCLAVLRPSGGSCPRAVKSKSDHRVVWVVKMDRKILEFKTPLLVKDVPVECSGSCIGLSKTVPQHLSLNYELKMGKVYYLLPASDSSSFVADTPPAGGVKRIKVVVTKQELEQLLRKKISVGDVLAGLE